MRRSEGMLWYKILQVLLVFWMILCVFIVIGFLVFPDSPTASGFYNFVGAAYVIIDALLLYMLFSNMRLYSIDAITSTTNILWYRFLCAGFLLVAGFLTFEHSLVSDALSSFLSTSIIFIPTYYYLRNRLDPRFIRTPKPESHMPISFDPLKIIPVKLMGVTDQAHRDRIITEYMGGNPDPYTGLPITNEQAWVEYFLAETEAQQEKSKPPSPIVQLDNDDNRIKFCRFCGKPLREDSKFCEYCGLSKS